MDDPLERAWSRFISAKQQVKIDRAKKFPSVGVMVAECQAGVHQISVARQAFNNAAREEYGGDVSILWNAAMNNCTVAGIRLFLDMEIVL